MLQFFKKGIPKDQQLVSEVARVNQNINIDFGGGCSIEKALVMSYLIKEYSIKTSVDIGVYRGRSFFPQAVAHKLYSKGKVYGIDPYSAVAAVQNDRADIQNQLKKFVAETDFEQLFKDVIEKINTESMVEFSEIIRKKSSDANEWFLENRIKIGLVHIDGNHDTAFVMEDVLNYLPILDEKAFIVLDDISWSSVQPAMAYLKKHATYVGKLINKMNDFALFARGYSKEEINYIKSVFSAVK